MVESTRVRNGREERTGVIKYLGEVLDSTKDLVDDLNEYMDDFLDHGQKIQHDVRRTSRKVMRADRDRESDAAEVRELRARIDELTKRLAEVETDKTPAAAAKK